MGIDGNEPWNPSTSLSIDQWHRAIPDATQCWSRCLWSFNGNRATRFNRNIRRQRYFCTRLSLLDQVPSPKIRTVVANVRIILVILVVYRTFPNRTIRNYCERLVNSIATTINIHWHYAAQFNWMIWIWFEIWSIRAHPGRTIEHDTRGQI